MNENASNAFARDMIMARKKEKLLLIQKKLRDALAMSNRKLSNVGRNEPCPCGSGKKFKKCCYHKIQPINLRRRKY